MTDIPRDTEVRQLLVHPAVWPHLVAWLDARGIDVNLMRPAGDDLATYVMSPRALPTAGEPMPCRVIDVDGEPARVTGDDALTETDLTHLADVIRAAKRRHEHEHGTDTQEPR